MVKLNIARFALRGMRPSPMRFASSSAYTIPAGLATLALGMLLVNVLLRGHWWVEPWAWAVVAFMAASMLGIVRFALSQPRNVVEVDPTTKGLRARVTRPFAGTVCHTYAAEDVVSVGIHYSEGEGLTFESRVRTVDGAVYALNRLSWDEKPALKAATAFLAALGRKGQELDRTFDVWTDGGKAFRDEYLQRLQRRNP